MSSLGKRKDRGEEDAAEYHGSTLFVSNLPYNATSTDLQTLFSDIAPVRSAFVVLGQGTGVSKGVGYVSFAIKEDAQSAFDTIEKEGIALNGRGLRVTWASTKPHKKEKGATAVAESQKAHSKPRVVSAPRDPLAIRTVIISGLPSSIDSKSLWKKVRKYAGAEQVEWPIKTEDGEKDPSTAHVLFSNPAMAGDAVSKLHARVFKGSFLSVSLKNRLETVAKTPKSAGKDKLAAPSRANRLIVRNVPFDITEQDLRAVFLPYGPIHSIHIPQTEPKVEADGDVKMEEGSSAQPAARGRGYAFVWMWSRNEAQKAMEGCNGMKLQTGYAAGLLEDKQKKKKERREEKKRLKAQEGNDEGDAGASEKPSAERVIAVDWAWSKDKWEEEKKKLAEEEDSGSDSEDSREGEEEEGTEDALGVHEGSEEESGDEDDDDRSDEDEPTKPALPPPETGTTLFVRNIPFEATEDELRTLFRSFGPLRYARITMDPVMGRSRGTGFACFWNKEDADKAVEQSEILRAETVGHADAPKKNPFTMPSILTPDPSALSAQNLVLHGRTLDVVRAVTRAEAGKLKEAGEKAREKADKRNMYLLREGVILPNTPAAETLSPVELEKRSNSFNARRTLLRSNPALYVSKTRLSIRQIPIFVTERMLKRLGIHAMRAFEADVKKDVREGLTEEEKAAAAAPEDEQRADAIDRSKKEPPKAKKSGRPTGVKQAKIVRQPERVDAVTGKGRSKGYGFLELNTHADALRVLRWTNNNSAVGPLFEEWWKAELEDLLEAEKKKKSEDSETRIKRIKEELEGDGRKAKGTLIVEFSIENVQVVQRRAAHQRGAKAAGMEGVKPREKLSLPKAEAEEQRPLKKQRRTGDLPKKGTNKADSAPNPNLGSLIGRKRKERKGKK